MTGAVSAIAMAVTKVKVRLMRLNWAYGSLVSYWIGVSLCAGGNKKTAFVPRQGKGEHVQITIDGMRLWDAFIQYCDWGYAFYVAGGWGIGIEHHVHTLVRAPCIKQKGRAL